MSVPLLFKGRLSVPVICSPMFLVSGRDLVVAACKAGVAGTFPALNARSAEELGEWLDAINENLHGIDAAPYGVNLILHGVNRRLEADLDVIIEHKVPFVITSLGKPDKVVEAVTAYGGLVFADVIHAQHARKAIESGVHGLIAVGNGAGGHAGTQSLFSLSREIREFWQGPLVLGGAISDGYGVRAAEILGADLAYVGTRFVATRESAAQPEYKQMLLDATAADIVYTDAISGTHANMLKQSIVNAYGEHWQEEAARRQEDGAKAWRDVWSAGQGVSNIHDIPTTEELVSRLAVEYRSALLRPISPALLVGRLTEEYRAAM